MSTSHDEMEEDTRPRKSRRWMTKTRKFRTPPRRGNLAAPTRATEHSKRWPLSMENIADGGLNIQDKGITSTFIRHGLRRCE